MAYTLDPNRPIKVKKALPPFIADRLPEGEFSEEERREFFMGEAIKMARLAASHGDVPVGCVIVRHNEIIAAAENRREAEKCATAHAEILAIEAACRALRGWRLVATEIYVTVEPCPMCAGAIVNARAPNVFIGTSEPKSGAFGSLFDLAKYPVNHKPFITFGILADECEKIISAFFEERR